MTSVILQGDSKSAEDQSHAAEHPSRSSEDLSGCKLKYDEDPSTQVPPRRWSRKSHYVHPPLIPTNLESRPVIRPIGDR
jgi:hypothetical protein